MRKITQALSAVCLLFALNSSAVALASSPSPLNPGTNVAKLAEQAPIHWVSVAQIENSLAGRPPMAVGFDIDDTVLFSSPGFWRGKKTFSPESEDYLKNPVFWEKMNNGWDEFSIPKEVACVSSSAQTRAERDNPDRSHERRYGCCSARNPCIPDTPCYAFRGS